MLEKGEALRPLAEAHRAVEPTINRIIQLLTDREDDTHEPLTLLEVNPGTSPLGIFPIALTALAALIASACASTAGTPMRG